MNRGQFSDPVAPSQPKTGGEAAAARPKLRPLLAFLPYVARYKIQVAIAGIALLVAAAITLAVPMAVRRMIDYGFSSDSSTFIDQYFAMLIAIAAVLAVASSARFYFVTWLGERVVSDIRAAVFGHVLALSPAFFDKAQTGEVISRLTADTTQIKSAMGVSVSIALRNFVLLVGAMTMMVITSPKLSGLVLGAIPFIVLPLVGFGRAVRRRSRHAQDTLAEATSYASEAITSVRTVQAFNAAPSAALRFKSAVERAFVAARSSMRARALLTAGAIFLVFASVVAVLWYGAQDVLDGTITGGTLGQFVLYAVFAAGAMGELSQVWGEISQAAGAAERLSELLSSKSAVQSPAHPRALPVPAQGRVTFDHVSFTYPARPEDSVLQDISFNIEPGETVAIVGPSGAGKSTIFHLLLRYYDPAGGKILIDGVPVNEAALDEVRARLAIVPQDTVVFAESIADNIRFGRPDASDAQVMAAAHAALVDPFVSALQEGYHTQVGERGITLSGGQRQRLAVARAILRDAPVLLLDEATSALDAESETLVQQALDHLMRGRTTIVIAHRLATVKQADRILVMDGGRIVEQGTHATLSAKNGLYSRLAKLQFGAGPGAGAGLQHAAAAAQT